eukprot:SAG11_NODE_18361_length_493_cov_0.885787_1_plen_41_part_10
MIWLTHFAMVNNKHIFTKRRKHHQRPTSKSSISSAVASISK